MSIVKNRRGVILIASYLIITVLVILGSVFVSRSITENKIAERKKESMQAFYLAEAGLDVACRGLSQNWVGYTTGLPRNNVFSQSLETGDFTVDIENGPLSDTIRVTSKGTAGAAEKTLEEIIEGTVGGGLPGFDFAVLAAGNLFLEGSGSIKNQDVYVNGNLEVHSSDAIEGGDAYVRGNATLLGEGGITGNVNANGNIVVNKDCTITGDATSAAKVNNLGTITGTSTSYAVPPPVDEEALQAKVDSYRLSSEDWDNYKAEAQAEGNYHQGTFYPSGSYTGVHYVTGSLVIESDVSGTAVFVVEGNVNMDQGIVDLTPPLGRDYSFVVGGNVQSTGTTSGTLGGVTYCGGNFNVGSYITLEGAVICFGNLHGSGDFSIEFPVAGTTLEIISWREL